MLNKICRTKDEHAEVEERGHWGRKVEYILAMAGSIVGIGNVWRFPYLCYKNGGGAFLVPYLVFLVTCGIPLFLLETAIGQYTQEGSITSWRKLCPLAQGIGYSGQLILTYGCVTYVIIEAWSLLYLVFSFYPRLPWASCSNDWNTDACFDFSTQNRSFDWTNQTNTTSAATEFWERRVLAISGGIDEIGGIRWELLLCTAVMWTIGYFCIWKGVKSTGKVVYVTAIFPYVMLLALLVRGLSLPGALQGVVFYLLPDPGRLADPQVWLDAGTQIFFSYSLCGGSLIVLSSYNAYNNNCYKDCLWLCFLNGCTSFVAGFAVFSVLGFMAHKQGVPIADVAESGPGLAFVAYPQAVAMMPLPQLWSVCFFFMLILLAVDTHFLSMEVVITNITDLFPKQMRKVGRRERLLLVFCLTCFFCQLILLTEAGMYVLQLMDYYAASGICILFLGVFESLAMGWIVGADWLCEVIHDMTGVHVNLMFKICWRYVTPLMVLGTLICSLVRYQPLTYNRRYVYPDWAYALGWTLCLSSMLLVLGWVPYKLGAETGTLRQRFRRLCQRSPGVTLTRRREAEQQQICGEAQRFTSD